MGSDGASSAIDAVALASRLSVFPHESVELFFRFDWQYSGSSSRASVNQYFADAGARYKVKSWEFELQFNNLSGQKTYVNRVFDGLDYMVYSYRLRPFEVLAVMRMTF